MQSTETMFRAKLPRLYELKDLTLDPPSPYAYFRDFETKFQNSDLAKRWYTRLEKKVQFLHLEAWTALKIEASQYLIRKPSQDRRKPDPGWAQLFDILCQADAYKYLSDLGCSEVNFIPRSGSKRQKTPDLEGFLGSQKVICEVKRINISDAERGARSINTLGMYEHPLNQGFFSKLQPKIADGQVQIHAYDPQKAARHIVYLSITFDEGSGFNRADELRQVEQYLNDNPPGVEVAYSPWN